jgi:hypothetical protein
MPSSAAPILNHPYQLRPQKPLVLRDGPWLGMHDAVDPTAVREGHAQALINCYVPGSPGQPVLGFPGFTQAGARLGGSSRKGQYIGQFTKQSGTTYTIAIVGGLFYTYNWGTDTWGNTVTAADFTAASITVDPNARIYASVLADNIIFNDGVNIPWMWDGTTLTLLSNCPVFTGPTCIYYAKYFGFSGGTFFWSEEGDPTIGYDALISGKQYNNAWDFPMSGAVTASAPLTALAATNEALYVFRSRQIAMITGAVSTDFQSAGTRAAISNTIGTISQPLVTDYGVLFVDAQSRPHLIRGETLMPIWDDCAETVRTVPANEIQNAVLLVYPPGDLVLIGLPNSGQTVPTQWLAFRVSGDAPRFVGLRNGFPADIAGLVENQLGVPIWMHSGEGDGYLYRHGNPDDALWDDELNAGTAAIDHTVTSRPIGLDLDYEKRFDRLLAIFTGLSDVSATAYFTTPRGTNSLPISLTGSGARLGLTFILGTSTLSSTPVQSRVVLRIGANGRYLIASIRHAELGEQFALVAVQTDAYRRSHESLVP